MTVFPSQATNVFYEYNNFPIQIKAFSPMGQSFLTNSPNTQYFGFLYVDCNAHLGASTITMNLHSGIGLSTSIIATSSFMASAQANGVHYLSTPSLINAKVYTFEVSASNAHGCIGLNDTTYFNPGPNYMDGFAYIQSVISPDQDLYFHLLDNAVDLITTANPNPPTSVLQGTEFSIDLQVNNTSAISSTNTDITFDTDFNIVSTSGCANDPMGFPTCTIADVSNTISQTVTVTLNSQSPVAPGLVFFSAVASNTVFEIDASNNVFQNNIDVLPLLIFSNGFE